MSTAIQSVTPPKRLNGAWLVLDYRPNGNEGYVVIAYNSGQIDKFVVCSWYPWNNGTWHQGNYFASIVDAAKRYEARDA
jgi:hypothetical protein